MVLLNFTAKFKIPAVESGDCCQTIRRNRYRQSKEYGRVLHNPKLGDRLQLYAGLRTKAARRLREADPIVSEVLPIRIEMTPHHGFSVYLGDEVSKSPDVAQPLGKVKLNALARADGFSSSKPFEKFEAYFAPQCFESPFEGVVIHWQHIELYRPSNGTEGESFMGRFCDRCTREAGKRECPILNQALLGNVQEWIYAPDTGEATCTQFRRREDAKQRRAACSSQGGKYRRSEALGQGNLFGWWLREVERMVKAPQTPAEEYLGLELRPGREQQNLVDHGIEAGLLPQDLKYLTYGE